MLLFVFVTGLTLFAQLILYEVVDSRFVFSFLAVAMLYVAYTGMIAGINAPEETADFERIAAGSIGTANRQFDLALERQLNKSVSKIRENADSLVSDRLQSLVEERFGENLVEKIGEQVANQAESFSSQKMLDNYLQATKSDSNARALQYANSSHKHAGTYRFFATLLAFFGVFVALWAILGYGQTATLGESLIRTEPMVEPVNRNFSDIVYRYAPLYLMVVLCEVLALILFRVSSKLSEQTRYFSNEATNNDLKFAAIKLAMHYGDPEDVVGIAISLQNTERNFILDKGQRTMEHLSNELEAKHVEEIASQAPHTRKIKKTQN